MPFGLIPWGTGFWGLNAQPQFSPIPPVPSNINIINIIPVSGAFNISRGQTFTFTIKSEIKKYDGTTIPGFTIEPTSIYIFLDNKPVVIAGVPTAEFAVPMPALDIDGVSLHYQITPNYLFRDGSVFTLQVHATDIYGNPSFPFWAGYVVMDTRPPLVTPIFPLDGYVDVPLDLSLHFLINQLIAPAAGLISNSVNIYVNDSPAVVNGIIQSAFDGIYSAINLPSATNITTPFEYVLDYANRYSAGDIVTVSASVDSIIMPVTDTSSVFLDQYGLPAKDAYGLTLPSFAVTNTLGISSAQNKLTLNFNISPNLIADGYVGDGYQIKNFNGNTFHILSIIDNNNILVETLPKTFRGKYSFVTAQFDSAPPTPVFAGYFQGIYFVDNFGDGYHINTTWHSARTSRPDDDIAYLIYYSTVRSDVFYEEPKLITRGKKLPLPETIHGADAQLFGYSALISLPVGVTYYFGVRATEYPHSDTMPAVPIDGYQVLSAGLKATGDKLSFFIPAPQLLMTAVAGSGAIVIPVTTTAGYATAGGYITVGAEIMRYTGLTNTTFVVASVGRGLFGSTIQPTHNVGERVKMYYGSYDDNTVIAKNIVTWESGNKQDDPHRTRPDLITTDFTSEDGYHTGFEPFDYCGYHRARPDELLNDTTCSGTYVGGEYGGQRGLFLYDRMLANEEQLLEVTGEPAILLRRVWGGETCICRTSRKDSAQIRSCSVCFGTGFKGGFIQYNNPRRDDKRIMVHFAPSEEEVGMKPQAGWDQTFKPGTWTIAVPAVKDRDVLVRFNEFGEMDWIYVVSAVSRAKSMFGRYARQKLTLNRLDKTDILYQYKLLK